MNSPKYLLSLLLALCLLSSPALMAKGNDACEASSTPCMQSMTVIFNLSLCGALNIFDLDMGLNIPGKEMQEQVAIFLKEQKRWEVGETYRVSLKLQDGQLQWSDPNIK